MERTLAVIGVGNMAKAIICGIVSSDLEVSSFYLFDKCAQTYDNMQKDDSFVYCDSIEQAVSSASCVLLSVKPQNYPEVLEQITLLPDHEKKLYISIAAGITSEQVSSELSGATVIRVLPNLPMTIGQGVSAICENEKASAEDFDFVNCVFASAGSSKIIKKINKNKK